eukprot:scaffold684_cov345-Pavlova_lutheri.AAC.54
MNLIGYSGHGLGRSKGAIIFSSYSKRDGSKYGVGLIVCGGCGRTASARLAACSVPLMESVLPPALLWRSSSCMCIQLE